MLRKLFYLPFIVGVIITQSHNIPPSALEQLVQKFYSFYKQHPQEKIHVQTDRSSYFGGDDLYGKVYLITETAGAVPDSMQSKKVYVELINDENVVVQKAVVSVLNSSLNFSFHLPDSIAAGSYLLRAYTAWMIHYGSKNVFSTYISVFNKPGEINASLAYKDSLFSTLVVQLHDSLHDAAANRPVNYLLLYKNRVVAKNKITTDAQGSFLVPVNGIPKQTRNEAALKVRIGQTEKLLYLPSIGHAIDVQFLPEGGSLVNDIDNKVAFKAINDHGHGVDVEGYVEDNGKNVVCTFRSQHLGMGNFSFTPISRHSYTVSVKYGGKLFRYTLAPAPDYAYQLSVVKRTSSAITARVALGDSLYQKGKVTYLVAQSRGTIYFTSQGQDLYEVAIPLKEAPEGITRLTLFDEAMHPVSERLVYVSHPQAAVRISADQDNYEKREKVTLQLKTEGPKGRPLQGLYAVSVTDDHIISPDENAANIKTNLLLSPYLQGYIEEPGYYFKSEDSTTQNNLDLVMLTHGWSRFTWQNIVDGKLATYPYIKDNGLVISGMLLDRKNAPLKQCRVSLFSKTDNTFIGEDTTNEQGGFLFPGIEFTDSTSFFIQVKNARGANQDATVIINPQTFPLSDIDRPVLPNEQLNRFQTGIVYHGRPVHDTLLDGALTEVVVTAVKRKVDYDESRRVSAVSYVIPRKTIEQFSNLSVMDLMYTVPGVTFMNGHVSFFGPSSFGDSASGFRDPLIVVDGVEMPSGGAVDLHTVDFVEVLRGGEAAIYGVRGGNGVILINTKQGKDAPVYYTQNGIKTLQVPGYHVERDFYAPKYTTEESRFSKRKDERVTVYWNGHVQTDASGNATVSFYTADAPTTYTVTLEGVLQNGAYVHQTARINRTK